MCSFQGRPLVLGASDRMITTGDIQYEPPVRKIYTLTRSIFALGSGDASANTEIVSHAAAAISDRLAKDTSWVRVEEAAGIVSQQVVAYRRRIAERTVLAAFGLTFDQFI